MEDNGRWWPDDWQQSPKNCGYNDQGHGMPGKNRVLNMMSTFQEGHIIHQNQCVNVTFGVNFKNRKQITNSIFFSPTGEKIDMQRCLGLETPQ